MAARGKRAPRGNGNHLAPAGHQHPLYSFFGEYFYNGRRCSIVEHHPVGAITRKAKDGEQFTIRQAGRLKIVSRKLVWKQPHPPRTVKPYSKRRRLGT